MGHGNSSQKEAEGQATFGETYEWTPTTQGVILGAFYYGYIIFQVPAGRFAEIYGGKAVTLIGLTSSGVITLITPWITSSLAALVTSRVLLGLGQGLIMSALFNINHNLMPKTRDQ
jgi:MFS family permease